MTPSTAFGRTAVSMRVRQTDMRHRLTCTGPTPTATFTIAQRRSRCGFGFDYGQVELGRGPFYRSTFSSTQKLPESSVSGRACESSSSVPS